MNTQHLVGLRALAFIPLMQPNQTPRACDIVEVGTRDGEVNVAVLCRPQDDHIERGRPLMTYALGVSIVKAGDRPPGGGRAWCTDPMLSIEQQHKQFDEIFPRRSAPVHSAVPTMPTPGPRKVDPPKYEFKPHPFAAQPQPPQQPTKTAASGVTTNPANGKQPKAGSTRPTLG